VSAINTVCKENRLEKVLIRACASAHLMHVLMYLPFRIVCLHPMQSRRMGGAGVIFSGALECDPLN
jgi:hypothetical protein